MLSGRLTYSARYVPRRYTRLTYTFRPVRRNSFAATILHRAPYPVRRIGPLSRVSRGGHTPPPFPPLAAVACNPDRLPWHAVSAALNCGPCGANAPRARLCLFGRVFIVIFRMWKPPRAVLVLSPERRRRLKLSTGLLIRPLRFAPLCLSTGRGLPTSLNSNNACSPVNRKAYWVRSVVRVFCDG